MREKIVKIYRQLKRNYRLSIYDRGKLTEVFSTTVSRLKFALFLLVIAFISMLIATLIIFYTPLKTVIPGFPSFEVWQSIKYNSMMTDSLVRQIEMRDSYLERISGVISGKNVDEPLPTKKDLKAKVYDESKLVEMANDSIFDRLIGSDEYRFSMKIDNEVEDLTKINFFSPVPGMVVNRFNASPGHFGTDIVGVPFSKISSVLEGTVIFAEWSVSTGYVIQIQHSHNLVSVYKHNSELLVKQGDKVKSGAVISIMGNEGELSTGPHLHFELWHKGTPLDAELYINF